MDKYRSYEKALKERYTHHAEKFDMRENPEHLKWLHRVIGNLKTWAHPKYCVKSKNIIRELYPHKW